MPTGKGTLLPLKDHGYNGYGAYRHYVNPAPSEELSDFNPREEEQGQPYFGPRNRSQNLSYKYYDDFDQTTPLTYASAEPRNGNDDNQSKEPNLADHLNRITTLHGELRELEYNRQILQKMASFANRIVPAKRSVMQFVGSVFVRNVAVSMETRIGYIYNNREYYHTVGDMISRKESDGGKALFETLSTGQREAFEAALQKKHDSRNKISSRIGIATLLCTLAAGIVYFFSVAASWGIAGVAMAPLVPMLARNVIGLVQNKRKGRASDIRTTNAELAIVNQQIQTKKKEIDLKIQIAKKDQQHYRRPSRQQQQEFSDSLSFPIQPGNDDGTITEAQALQSQSLQPADPALPQDITNRKRASSMPPSTSLSSHTSPAQGSEVTTGGSGMSGSQSQSQPPSQPPVNQNNNANNVATTPAPQSPSPSPPPAAQQTNNSMQSSDQHSAHSSGNHVSSYNQSQQSAINHSITP